jgi:TPR repeat protein
MLATMYEKGLGVGADPAEAAKWRAAAESATS